MNVPYYKGKKSAWAFLREKSSSLIIHENRFWPYFGHFIQFHWFILADIANLDGLNRYTSINSVEDVGKGH